MTSLAENKLIEHKRAVAIKLAQQHLAGVLILAGGLSTRMGSPKALLPLPTGETLLAYHVRHARQLGVPVLIADNGQGFMISDVEVTPSETDTSAADPFQTSSFNTDTSDIDHVLDYQPQPVPTEANANDANVDTPSKPKHSAGPLGAILAGMQHALSERSSQDSQNSQQRTVHYEQYNADHKQYDKNTLKNEAKKWLMVISCDSLVNALDVWHCLNLCNLNKLNKLNNLNKLNSLNKLATQSVQNAQSTQNTLTKEAQPQVYCLADNERDYPLLALYQLSLAPGLQAYLDAGERRVMRFIQSVGQPIVMPQAWHTLSNLNTPAQFDNACQQLFR